MFGLWRTVNNVLFYLTLAVGLAGLLGNGLVLWHLGLHIRKGPLSLYLLHLAAADFLFLGCQVGLSAAEAALGSRDSLHFVVPFVGFCAGLWLLAAFSAERCLSHLFPACYGRRRPRHTSAAVCGLIWALTPPAVLLPAHACGLLGGGARPGACLRFHAASVAWLLSLVGGACGAGLVLSVWGGCCSRRPRPRFFGVTLGCALLLLLCGLPLVVCWSLRPLLGPLLPLGLPPATLLACVHGSAKPLLHFAAGRQPGPRQPLRAVLRRALGEQAPREAGGLSLPMGLL
ncbi:mas-related G-protein coupled receptor member G [Meles meles]|uniref:mas-related G-protein coupled receptor member G n=1 Tax=Meles meles TaxID=9662 RepID=UPI001E69F0B3|nr:mas-related G-protein coupled receptor member G [Meles meles]